MTCLITGCALISFEGTAWGDLHRIEGTYIFNAVLKNGETAWDYLVHEHDKVVDCTSCNEYFERRGVICFSAYEATLNDVAEEYLS